jgi:NADH-quinone oxidoreductase subunit J
MEFNLFLIFSSLALLSAVFVVTAKNPIHSILFLVFVFFNISGLLIMLGVEFLAMLLLVVYVGAVSVLFLFVIMMLNVKIAQAYENLLRYIPIGFFLSLSFLFECYLIVDSGLVSSDMEGFQFLNNSVDWVSLVIANTNTVVIGTILYTYYSFFFILCGFILLISMVGAITLTLSRRGDVRRQEIYKQLQVSFKNSIKFIKR